MKHTIEIEGLPEGWEPVAFRIAHNDEHRVINGIIERCDGNDNCESLIVKKKQPRRIVLEEITKQGDYFLYFENRYWRIVEDSGENDD